MQRASALRSRLRSPSTLARRSLGTLASAVAAVLYGARAQAGALCVTASFAVVAECGRRCGQRDSASSEVDDDPLHGNQSSLVGIKRIPASQASPGQARFAGREDASSSLAHHLGRRIRESPKRSARRRSSRWRRPPRAIQRAPAPARAFIPAGPSTGPYDKNAWPWLRAALVERPRGSWHHKSAPAARNEPASAAAARDSRLPTRMNVSFQPLPWRRTRCLNARGGINDRRRAGVLEHSTGGRSRGRASLQPASVGL